MKSDPPNPLTLFMNVPKCKSLIKVRSQYWIESRISDNIDSINYFFFWNSVENFCSHTQNEKSMSLNEP